MDRRRFVSGGAAALGWLALGRPQRADPPSGTTLFLCGDVMTGRGIDQILPRPGDPTLYEPYVRHAGRYVELAEAGSGEIARPVAPSYVWGEALAELERRRPAARIANLETAITDGGEPAPEKGIHYRMHPANVGCLEAAALDCCVLANNHVLDWGPDGLADTLAALAGAGIAAAGAGRDARRAAAPAVLPLAGGRRLLVFAFAVASSGVPPSWAARGERPGVSYLPELSDDAVRAIGELVAGAARPGDLVAASIHWGGNWGYAVPPSHRRFARGLVERAGVHLVHGHSSHHPLGIEVHRGRLILHGCGDFVNDYEGIGGHEEYRGELVVAYFPTLETDGSLARLAMAPFRSRRLRLERAAAADRAWLARTLDRESQKLGARVVGGPADALELRWTAAAG